MIQQERFARINNYLKKNQSATLADIAALNQVSIDTVRRDLEKMESQNLLKRVRGGAVRQTTGRTEHLLEVRDTASSHAKRELVTQLGDYVREGQTIALNSGTTSAEAAKFLVEEYERLIVITNNLQVLEILSAARKFTAIVPGGVVSPRHSAIFGNRCERDILRYNVDVAILTVQAISVERGITDSRMSQAGILRTMIAASQRQIFMADHTRFHRTASMDVCPTRKIDLVLSDSAFPEELRVPFSHVGVTIVTPNKP